MKASLLWPAKRWRAGVPVVNTDCCTMLGEMITIPEAGRIVKSRSARRPGGGAAVGLQGGPAAARKFCALVAPFRAAGAARGLSGLVRRSWAAPMDRRCCGEAC